MTIENITSRKNKWIVHMRTLAADGAYRRSCREYVCDGEKLLREAIQFGAELRCVLWSGEPTTALPASVPQFRLSAELAAYTSPLKNSPGPVFSVAMSEETLNFSGSRILVLESVQDPGNVGTVIRTANALRMDAVILTGACADLYHPKTVRATMGAMFRQRVLQMELGRLQNLLGAQKIPLYGAALSSRAQDLREIDLTRAAVAIGSEGRGLSREILDICAGELIIPMAPECESLNAAVAASIVMWEMSR
jgi:TrmH family RNA methyltransferase